MEIVPAHGLLQTVVMSSQGDGTGKPRLLDGRALAKRWLLERKRIEKLSAGSSYLSIAFDVVGLVGLFLEHWSAIEGKTGMTLQELDGARKGASALVAAIGQRQQGDDEDDSDDQIHRET